MGQEVSFLLVYNTRPPLPSSNKMDCGGADACNYGQRVSGYACSQRPSYVNNLPLSQLVLGVGLASKVNKAGLPLMPGVVRQGHPLQVFGSVVQLVAVDMVYRQSRGMPRDECHRHQSVNKDLGAQVTELGRDHVIPVFRHPGPKLCLRSHYKKLLQLPKAYTRCLNRGLWSKNPRICANKPVQALFVNRYDVHAVDNTAGHL